MLLIGSGQMRELEARHSAAEKLLDALGHQSQEPGIQSKVCACGYGSYLRLM